MRIAIDAHMLGDHSGGNESHYRNLINSLRIPVDVELYLFIMPECNMAEITVPCKCVRFRAGNPIQRNFVEIPRLVKKYKIDVLHMQYFIPFHNICKTVVTIHDISFEHYKDIFTKKDYITQKLLIPYAAKHADLIFTVSEFSKYDIMRKYQIERDKICVIYNGISNKYHKIKCGEQEKKKFLEERQIEAPYILCVGNLQPRKNLKRLLQAYVKFRNEVKQKVKLVMVGAKAWLFDDIFSEIETAGLQEDVVFPGYVTEEELIKLYNFSIFFVYPSFFEGFGLPVLEAMACGVPVGTSNVTSLPEIAGEAALLFDPFDVDDILEKMLRLYQDEKLRADLCARAREQVKKFDWAEIAGKAMEQYRKLAERKGGPRKLADREREKSEIKKKKS